MRNVYQTKIESFFSQNKRMPTYSEMMGLFGLKSKNAIFKIVNKLIDAGIVAKDHLGRLVPSKSFGEVPMLGYVTAGLPASVDEELTDTINLDNFLINNKAFTYMLEVDGDSMIDAHIEKGDMVLVEKANQAKDMQIVIAEVDGEYTMKYFRRSTTLTAGKVHEKVWLEPANKKYSPIHPENSLNVIAVLKAVIRKY